MAFTTLDSLGDLGIQGLLNFPNLDTPQFYPLFLFVIFFVMTSLSFFREVAREGKGNIFSSAAVAGYVTIVIASLLSVMGLIATAVLVTTIVASLIFQVLFLLTKKS